MQKLYHQASKTLKRTWDANGRADFDQDAFRGMDIDLKLPSLVHGRVEKGKQAL